MGVRRLGTAENAKARSHLSGMLVAIDLLQGRNPAFQRRARVKCVARFINKRVNAKEEDPCERPNSCRKKRYHPRQPQTCCCFSRKSRKLGRAGVSHQACAFPPQHTATKKAKATGHGVVEVFHLVTQENPVCGDWLAVEALRYCRSGIRCSPCQPKKKMPWRIC